MFARPRTAAPRRSEASALASLSPRASAHRWERPCRAVEAVPHRLPRSHPLEVRPSVWMRLAMQGIPGLAVHGHRSDSSAAPAAWLGRSDLRQQASAPDPVWRWASGGRNLTAWPWQTTAQQGSASHSASAARSRTSAHLSAAAQPLSVRAFQTCEEVRPREDQPAMGALGVPRAAWRVARRTRYPRRASSAVGQTWATHRPDDPHPQPGPRHPVVSTHSRPAAPPRRARSPAPPRAREPGAPAGLRQGDRRAS